MKRTHFLFPLLLLIMACGAGADKQVAQGAAQGGEAAAQGGEAAAQGGEAAAQAAGELSKPDGTPGNAEAAPAQTVLDENAVRMEKHEIFDRETNMKASSYLIPKGWKVDEKLYWLMADNIVPVRYEATVKSPDGREQIQFLPRFMGSYYYNALEGKMIGLEPSADAEACIRDYVLPFNRKGLDYKIVGTKPFKVEGIPSQGAFEARSSGATTTIEYEQGGQTYQEDFTVTLFTLTSHMAMMDMDGQMRDRPSGQMTVDQAFAVKAPKGKLEEARKLAMASVGSVRPELAWFNQVQQVSQMLQKQFYQNLAAQGERSRILAQTNREISASITSTWEKQQESQDRMHHNFTNYIRDVDDYKTPESGSSVSLPSGYSNVFTNGSEYILTNTQYDPTHDVNQNTTWQRMEQANP